MTGWALRTPGPGRPQRSEEHTSELQSPCISYAVFCLKKKFITARTARSARTGRGSREVTGAIDMFALVCYYFFVSLLLAELVLSLFFFFNDTATTEIYTLSLHDALPI